MKAGWTTKQGKKKWILANNFMGRPRMGEEAGEPIMSRLKMWKIVKKARSKATKGDMAV